jgi:hypothetical protein
MTEWQESHYDNMTFNALPIWYQYDFRRVLLRSRQRGSPPPARRPHGTAENHVGHHRLLPGPAEPRSTQTEAEREVRRRLEHVIKTFRAKTAQPVSVDFSSMPSQVINEAAHGNE